MFTDRERARFLETAMQASRWYFNNQNTDEHPWGGIAGSADKGRFVYEYRPVEKKGKAASIWAQALGVMSLHSVSIKKKGWDGDESNRRAAALLAGDYMLLIQNTDKSEPANYGGFYEARPKQKVCNPRDGITGGMGLCALYKMTKDEKYLEAARLFADWYHRSAKDEEGWPYMKYDFELQKGYFNKNEVDEDAGGFNSFVKGDWQIGGAVFFYQLAQQTGERKYIDEYMMPMMEQLVEIYKNHPVTDVVHGFHGFYPVCFGNDDFALVSMLCAYCATGEKQYYTIARDRIMGQIELMDECGSFPSYGGTFNMGIAMKVLFDIQKKMGIQPNDRLCKALRKTALHGMKLQALDYNDARIHGGFWGQTNHGVGRHTIHHRSTGYATIFYSMLTEEENNIPYYNCLNWGYEPEPVD